MVLPLKNEGSTLRSLVKLSANQNNVCICSYGVCCGKRQTILPAEAWWCLFAHWYWLSSLRQVSLFQKASDKQSFCTGVQGHHWLWVVLPVMSHFERELHCSAILFPKLDFLKVAFIVCFSYLSQQLQSALIAQQLSDPTAQREVCKTLLVPWIICIFAISGWLFLILSFCFATAVRACLCAQLLQCYSLHLGGHGGWGPEEVLKGRWCKQLDHRGSERVKWLFSSLGGIQRTFSSLASTWSKLEIPRSVKTEGGDSGDEHLQRGCLNDTAGEARGALTAETFPFPALGASCSTDQHLASAWGWGFHCCFGPVWLPNHLQQGQISPVVPTEGCAGFYWRYSPVQGVGRFGFLWALGSPGALFCPAGTVIRLSALVHLFLTVAGAWQKSNRFLGGNQPLASLQENWTPISFYAQLWESSGAATTEFECTNSFGVFEVFVTFLWGLFFI